ncbi:hypothetical protein [Shouchella clausii]|uniref:hypothetical protein n=1 Tax=Shouchella clausii TaxID=79880 RepID=UPI001C73723E|nr:hypothetical protein [Shouchella clausii]MBX0320252.1 hypothetical protein [Shouchella clausii]MEB5480731.1 hypothetical protein [Shouchella clausii]
MGNELLDLFHKSEYENIDKNEMKKGYLEMAKINLDISSENFETENEAEKTTYKFLGK